MMGFCQVLGPSIHCRCLRSLCGHRGLCCLPSLGSCLSANMSLMSPQLERVWCRARVLLHVCLALILTCADPILQGVSAVNQDLLQGLGVVGELQVEALHAFQQLVWVMEVQHLGGAIERLADIVEKYVHHLQEELHSLLLPVLSWKQIWEWGANEWLSPDSHLAYLGPEIPNVSHDIFIGLISFQDMYIYPV